MQISASILSADLSLLAAVAGDLERAEADMLHFDVMDGHFVPNLTFGMPVLQSLRPKTHLFLDVHLMIADPLRYASQFVRAGADLVTFHLESESDPQKAIDAIHAAGAKAGIAIKPGTPWEAAKPYLPKVELVLVMTVEPGFGGQSFQTAMLSKIRALKDYLSAQNLPCEIEADGGIDNKTATQAFLAGAEILVVGSFLFRQPELSEAVRRLRESIL